MICRRAAVSLMAVIALCAPRIAAPIAQVQPVSLPVSIPAGPAWARNQPIYEVNLAICVPHHTFRELEAQLPRLKQLGVGIVWLMPIHSVGVLKAFGSVYCVRDYYAVNPAYGTVDDLRHLVRRAHALGLHVLMDWVPNHSSWDNGLITQHPSFYKHDASGNVAPTASWRDVAQLDYGNRALWDWMLQAMTYWIKTCDVDGFRCDYAGGVPIEFWSWLRPRLNAVKPSLFMLAEANEPRHHPAFDMTYDWNLTQILFAKPRLAEPARALAAMLAAEARDYPQGAIRMRFITNHDLASSNPLREWLGNGIGAWAVVCATLPGKPLIYCGQEAGIDGPLSAPIAAWGSPWNGFYTKLLRLYQTNPALSMGDFHEIRLNDDGTVLAFRRQSGNRRVVVVVNLSDATKTVVLRDPRMAGDYTELFTGVAARLSGEVSVSLDAWGYRVYTR